MNEGQLRRSSGMSSATQIDDCDESAVIIGPEKGFTESQSLFG
jgi:16S rRNA U1498 N3-methylase RsmE